LRLLQSTYGKNEEYFLFGSIMDATMIDKRLGDKPLFFEISMGNSGNSLDGHNFSSQESEVEEDDSLGRKLVFLVTDIIFSASGINFAMIWHFCPVKGKV